MSRQIGLVFVLLWTKFPLNVCYCMLSCSKIFTKYSNKIQIMADVHVLSISAYVAYLMWAATWNGAYYLWCVDVSFRHSKKPQYLYSFGCRNKHIFTLFPIENCSAQFIRKVSWKHDDSAVQHTTTHSQW